MQGAAEGPVTVDAATAAEHGFEGPTVETVDFEERLAVAGVSLNPVTYAPLKQTVTHVFPYLPMETPEVTWSGETTADFGNEEVTAGEYAVDSETRLVVARTTVGVDTVFAVGVYPAENPDACASVDAVFGELTHA